MSHAHPRTGVATAGRTVYHGTSAGAVEPIRRKGLATYRRGYTRRRCACTTTELRVGQLFATRRSSSDGWAAGRLDGVVLEFVLDGRDGVDFTPARDPSCMQEEREVAVFDPTCLSLVAVWRHDGQNWQRQAVREEVESP